MEKITTFQSSLKRSKSSLLELELNQFLAQFPLSSGWQRPTLSEDQLAFKDFTLYIIEIKSIHKEGMAVRGRAASWQTPPVKEAYFEFLEHVVLSDKLRGKGDLSQDKVVCLSEKGASPGSLNLTSVFPPSLDPKKWTYSPSNGVASHPHLPNAKELARNNLIERDALLRSWYGEIPPVLRPWQEEGGTGEAEEIRQFLKDFYNFSFYIFSSPMTKNFGITVGGLFAFPKNPKVPFIFGVSSGKDLDKIFANCQESCFKRLAPLWGENFLGPLPKFVPHHFYHQEYFLRPQGVKKIKQWLAGGHHRGHSVRAPHLEGILRGSKEIVYVDLTPSPWKHSLHVVKALSENLLPLFYGRSYPLLSQIPQSWHIHPIC